MNIALVEDNPRDADNFRKALASCAAEMEFDYILDVFSDGDEFFSIFTPGKYELIFLDNYVKNEMGIAIARQIRKRDDDAAIAFITMSPDFALTSYEVDALHYIIKPVQLDELAEVFRRWRKMPESPNPPSVSVVSGWKNITLPTSSILFIEVNHKVLTIHTNTREIRTYMGIDHMESMLPSEKFLRSHRSFLVNMDKIAMFQADEFVLKSGEHIPIRHNGGKDVKKRYIEYILASR